MNLLKSRRCINLDNDIYNYPDIDVYDYDATVRSSEEISEIIHSLFSIINRSDNLNFNLCDINYSGKSIFCDKNLDVPRHSMPQLKSKVSVDSLLYTLAKSNKINYTKDSDGNINEIDCNNLFALFLKRKGYDITNQLVPAELLYPTQNELNCSKVSAMYFKLLEKNDSDDYKNITDAIYVTRDAYVLDGHHRWAAQIALNHTLDIDDDILIKTKTINCDIDNILELANLFCNRLGLLPEKTF